MSNLITENRPCGDCKHFRKDFGANVIGICQKLLMTVTENMKVTYEKNKGTCFEDKIKTN